MINRIRNAWNRRIIVRRLAAITAGVYG